jgi:putative transcriptional regulator
VKTHAKKASNTFDWPGADALTDEQIHAAALADPDPDPDAQPRTPEQVRQMKPVPLVKPRIRPRLTQEQLRSSSTKRDSATKELAKRYGTPMTALCDWEQGRSEPDQAVQS